MVRPLLRSVPSFLAWLACLAMAAPIAFAQVPAEPPDRPAATPAPPPEPAPASGAAPAEGVPVMYRGQEIYRVYTGFGAFTAAERARLASDRLDRLVNDPAFDPREMTVVDTETTSEIRAGERLLGVVTALDATRLGQPRREIAATVIARVADVVINTREELSTRALVLAFGAAAVATCVYGLVLWLASRVVRRVRRRVRALGTQGFLSLQFQRLSFVTREQGEVVAHKFVRALHAVVVVVATFAWLEAVLAALPWSRHYATRLVSYVVDPLRGFGLALLEFLPDFFAIFIISVLAFAVLRFLGLFFRQVAAGRIEFEDFPAEWADPTYKLLRVLVLAIAAVMAFPYIPGSQSPAFQGVTLFVGFLVSFASSSSLSNIIAGTILTYTRAFRIGDRVQIGGTVGDVVASSLLVTDLRTIKNVVVAIPNAMVLRGPVVNYSRMARTTGLILNTSVTIGYDAPWRTVHGLLVAAAAGTTGVEASPEPFVLQTALNDFYVSYEINAYTRRPNDMHLIYAELHANIQDRFNEAGVEIMSPHYRSLRDGHTVTIPEGQRPEGYQAPGFRIAPPDPPRGA